MNKYFKSILFIISIFLLISMQKWSQETYIWFPEKLGIVQNCPGKEAEISFEIYAESNKKIEVYAFSLANTKFTIYKDDQLVNASDTLILTEKNPLKMKISFQVGKVNPHSLVFKTNLRKFSLNHIKLVYGEYHISGQEIRSSKTHIIPVSESCNDSVKVFFPFGGTISDVNLYKDSSQLTEEYKSISYMYGEEANSMTFSKADIGSYYVKFGSCHWGNDFWLTIK